jgi:hypothetical protein
MKYTSIVLAFAALFTGLSAAWYWYKSSKIVIDPGWGMPGVDAHIEPVVPELRQLDLQVATDRAVQQIGALNKVASLLTAISVALGSTSSIVGALT